MVLNLLSLSQHMQRETQRDNNPHRHTKSKSSKKSKSRRGDAIIKSYYERCDDETASICSFDDYYYDDIDSFCGSSSVGSKDSKKKIQSSSSSSAGSIIKLLPQEDLQDDEQSEVSLHDMTLLEHDRRGSSSSLRSCSFRPQDSYIGLLQEGDLLALDISPKEQEEEDLHNKSKPKTTSNNAFRVAFQLRKKPIGTIVEAVMEDTTFGRNINFLQRKVSAICKRKNTKKET